MTTAPLLHIRVQGRSQDVPLAELSLPAQPRPDDIRRAAGKWLALPFDTVQNLVLDPRPNGNYVLRPAAVFG